MKRLALVLAGGGSTGAYEVGAIKALYESGYHFDLVTGTSIGALNGYYVATHKFDEAIKLWNEITIDQVMANPLNINKSLFNNFSLQNVSEINSFIKNYLRNHLSIDIEPLRQFLKRNIDPTLIAKSDIKLGIATTLYPSFKGVDVVLNDVEPELVLPFLHASSACVPAFPVEEIRGQKYIDGFFYDNLPIRLAFLLGASDAIAINMRVLSIKGQNAYLLNLPNVQEIAPYHDLGSILDFSQETIQKNMRLGYLDAYKMIGKYKGYSYCFEGDFPFENFISKIYRYFGPEAKYIFEIIQNSVREKLNEEGYMIRAFELLMKDLNIDDYLSVHTYDSMIRLIKAKLVSVSFKNNTLSILKRQIEKMMKFSKNMFHNKTLNSFFIYLCENYLSSYEFDEIKHIDI